jgi:hypothetical protein
LLSELVDIVAGATARPPGAVAIGGDQWDAVAHALTGAPGDRADDVEITEEGDGGAGGRRQAGGGTLRFFVQAQHEPRVGEHQLADRRRAIDVRLVQATDLARGQAARGDRLGQPHAGGRVGARQGDEVLHRRMRREPPVLDPPLHDVGQLAHQAQPPRHPAHAAVEAARQLLHGHAVILHQRAQEPAFLDGTRGPLGVQTVPEDQRLRLGHLPADRLHRVAMQPLQAPHALVPVDDDVRIAERRDHHDRHLLPELGERGQQPPFAGGLADPQRLVPSIELVKFELHGCSAGVRNPASHSPRLVLRHRSEESARSPFKSSDLDHALVFRGNREESAPFPSRINDLRLALVLRSGEEDSAHLTEKT